DRSLDFHPENRAFPGGEEVFGDLQGLECRAELAQGLTLRNALREGLKPPFEYPVQLLADEVAGLRHLEAEVADQATSFEPVGSKALDDHVQVPLHSRPRTRSAVL